MTILVIGSAGFIGRGLADQLVSEGHDVRGMDVRLPAETPSYPCLTGDIRNKADIVRSAHGADLIINLAAEHRDFGITTESYFAVNDQGTQNVVEAAAELGIERVFFFSSVAVYGPGTSLTEDTPVAPAVTYGASKVAGERRMSAWVAQDPKRHAVILRPTVVFGPHNFGNMYNLIRTIAAGRFVMVGSGTNIKSVAYVDNVVAATLFLIRQMKPGVEVYNYSDYPQTSVGELVKLICGALGRRPPRVRLPLAPVLAAAQGVDLLGRLTGYDFPITANRIRKLNNSSAIVSDRVRKLGFRQSTSIEDAIDVTVGWYRNHRESLR